ncbi:hypothetical protein [Salinimonas chungwhensis]|uniref:hypothetical protein n=1 Tax=Salinimonas chungwhensis TaxID=265425 RepID=UPI0003736445|nr:hypothetical protein [Salinimonas chungwhensis]
MSKIKPVVPNRIVAGIWLVLSILLAGTAITLMSAGLILLVPAILGLAWLVFVMARQRTVTLALPVEKYERLMRWSGLITALWASLATALTDLISLP